MQDRLDPGTVLSHFEIVSHLGSGGMGEVYKARDTALDRSVAIKIIPTNASRDSSRMQRFVQEAKAASALNHPNIVTVYEIGTIGEGKDRRHFIAMELIEGGTLRDLLAERISHSRVVEILGQVADGLAKAHAAGIVHRDLKPENIMVTREGLVKILDFGLAKLMAAEGSDPHQATAVRENLTRDGTVVGTVNYMSPEQLRGTTVDHRSDIFSLGCLLYEMTGGRQPFHGVSAADTMHNILFEEPQPLGDVELELIARKALAKSPEDRYQSSREFAEALRGIQKTITTAPAIRAPSPSRKRWIIGVAAAAGAVAITGLVWMSLHRTTVTPTAFAQMQIAPIPGTSKALEVALSPDGKYLAYRREGDRGQSLIVRQMASGSEVELIPESVAERRGLTFSPDSNYLYYIESHTVFAIPVFGGVARRVLDNVSARAVSFAPDGRRLVFNRTGSLFTANVDGSDPKRIAGATRKDTFTDLAWSRDGNTIAAVLRSIQGALESRIQSVHLNVADTIADAATAPYLETRVFPGSWTMIDGVVWLPDGSAVVAAALPSLGGLRQLFVTEFKRPPARRITNDLFNYSGVSISKDGTLASLQTDVRWRIVEVTLAPGGQPRDVTEAAGSYVTIATAPDGEVVYSSLTSNNLNLWSADHGATHQLTSGLEDDYTPAVSPDGKSIVYAAERIVLVSTDQITNSRSHTITIWRMDRDGRNQKQLTFGNYQSNPSWSADGREIVFTTWDRGRAELMKVLADGGPPTLIPTPYAIRATPSPDGKKIAAVNQAFKLGVIDAKSGATIRSLETAIPNQAIHWTADSRKVAFISHEHGIFNILVQDIEGGPARPLTHFDSGGISSFDWGKGQQSLLCARGSESRRIVLITGWR